MSALSYEEFMRETGFDLQQSDTRGRWQRQWSVRFPASFKVGNEQRFWLVRAYTSRGAFAKSRRRRRKDLDLLASVNREDWPRHAMKAAR